MFDAHEEWYLTNGKKGTRAVFRDMTIDGDRFSNKLMADCEFINCNLTNVDFSCCNMTYSLFKFCRFNNVVFNDVLLNKILVTDCSFEAVEFRDCSLHDAEIVHSRFADCDIHDSDAKCMDIMYSMIAYSQLRNLDLRFSHWTDVRCVNSDLDGCNLSDAIMDHCKMDHSVIMGGVKSRLEIN